MERQILISSSKKHIQTALLLCGILICVLVTGCQFIETVYTWKRTPTEIFTVQLKLDGDKKLMLLEQYDDGTGNKYQPVIRDYFRPCAYFDKENWECDQLLGMERAVMSNGKFTHYYWTEERVYASTANLRIQDILKSK